jgi:hypothetical protein
MSEVFLSIVNEFKIDDFGTVQIPQYPEILSKNENIALDLFLDSNPNCTTDL